MQRVTTPPSHTVSANLFQVHRVFAVDAPRNSRDDLDMSEQRRHSHERGKLAVHEHNMAAYNATCAGVEYHLHSVRCLLNEAEQQFSSRTGGASRRPSISAIVARRGFHRLLRKLGLVWELKLRREVLTYHEALVEIGSHRLFGARPPTSVAPRRLPPATPTTRPPAPASCATPLFKAPAGSPLSRDDDRSTNTSGQ